MSFTKSDLAIRILRDLSVISSTETPQAEDQQYVEDTITSEFAMMQADGIEMSGTFDDWIDPTFYTLLARRIGLAVAPAFGIISVADAQNALEAATDVLRRLSVNTKNPKPLTVERAARGYRNGTTPQLFGLV